MPRFSFRSRFRANDDVFERREIRGPIAQTRTLADESHLFDIAEAHFDSAKYGTARISCWLSPEGVKPGRRWGKYKSADAVIVPFRTKASLSEDNARLNTFELELLLCSSEPESHSSISFSEPCPMGWSGNPCKIHSEVRLVDLPAPESMVGASTDLSPDDSMLRQPWKLRSEAGCSCGNSERAAKWIWDAKGHDPIALYGGLALQHTGRPFLVACRVNGQAFVKQSNGRVSSILKFGGEKSELKWWRIEPKMSDEDLSIRIEHLQDEIRRLNLKSTTSPSAGPGAGTDNSQSHSFATTTIGGNATAILGNLTIGSDSVHRVFNVGDQQYNPIAATLGLPRPMGSS